MVDILKVALGTMVGFYLAAMSFILICTILAEAIGLGRRIKKWWLKRQIRKGTSQMSVKAAPSDEGLDKLDILV